MENVKVFLRHFFATFSRFYKKLEPDAYIFKIDSNGILKEEFKDCSLQRIGVFKRYLKKVFLLK